jgi:hypothetical protein
VKQNEKEFAQMYNHTYDFIRGDDEKLLPLSKALKAWKTLLVGDVKGNHPSQYSGSRFPLFPLFEQWAVQHFTRRLPPKPGSSAVGEVVLRDVPRDLWLQMYEFSRRVHDVEEYRSSDEWSSVFDDFVEWAKAQALRGSQATAAAVATAAIAFLGGKNVT